MIQTVSLQTAKLLKENGFRQDTYLNWHPKILNPKDKEWVCGSLMCKEYISAPTTDEILEELPAIRIQKHLHKGKWNYYVEANGIMGSMQDDNSFPEVLAQMWLYLKKEGLLESKE